MHKKFWWVVSIFLIIVSLFLVLIGIYIYRLKYIDNVELGYAGAILGGSMTLVGVSWSIRDMKLQRSDDVKNRYLPIPIISKCKKSDISILDDSLFLEFELEVKNIGSGPLLKIEFDDNIPFFGIMNKTIFIPDEYGFGCPYSLDKNKFFSLYFPKAEVKIDKTNNEFLYFTHFQYVDAFDRKYGFYLKTEVKWEKNSDGEILSYNSVPQCYQIDKNLYEHYKKLLNL